jgi:homopolymeric O-antigen transport system ATP-binding protein
MNPTPTAISIHGLGKRYRIGSYVAAGNTLRGWLTDWLNRNPREGSAPGEPQYLWALHDITLDIPVGEVVGVIGRNGVGKSTLLKILSRITDPTEGYAELRGKTSSLLEVGTGFHAELTGRENIYLSGAVFGMSRAEVDRRFDEIVAFSELEPFLDTPVKRYSSGMYVRLGFAVAAHLDPDILLVDEVLAVGDLSFQRRCLNRMNDVAQAGRTVLFVSHQMTAIRRLCSRTLWLEAGRIKEFGPTGEVVARYETESLQAPAPGEGSCRAAVSYLARYLSWRIGDVPEDQASVVSSFGPVTFLLTVDVQKAIPKAYGGFEIRDTEGDLIWSTTTYEHGVGDVELTPGENVFRFRLPSLPIRPGTYRLHASLYNRDGQQLLDDWWAVPELIVATEPQSHSRDEGQGVLNIPAEFQVHPAPEGAGPNTAQPK